MKNAIAKLTTYLAVIGMLFISSESMAQIGTIWSTQSDVFAFLGSANMDSDPNEELVYFNPAPDRIIIFDGLTGDVDWDSGEWDYIGIAGYISSDGMLRGNTPFCDVNNDGIKEITFRGQQYLGAPFTIYLVGQGGAGISPGGGQMVPDLQILSQNYPNPFNPATTIQYTITAPDNVTIKIYNSLGREVRTLVSEFKHSGEHMVSWDGKDKHGSAVSSGTYFYQMQVGDYTSAKKAILLK